jgi:hypothetical protein
VIGVNGEERIDVRRRSSADDRQRDVEGARRMREGIPCGDQLEPGVADEKGVRPEARLQREERDSEGSERPRQLPGRMRD